MEPVRVVGVVWGGATALTLSFLWHFIEVLTIIRVPRISSSILCEHDVHADRGDLSPLNHCFTPHKLFRVKLPIRHTSAPPHTHTHTHVTWHSRWQDPLADTVFYKSHSIRGDVNVVAMFLGKGNILTTAPPLSHLPS